MAQGWCTLEDVRRALREASLPGDVDQDNRIAVDAIVAQTEELEKTYKRYWYADASDDIVSEATDVDIPQSPATRDDEHDIPRHAAMVHGESEEERFRYSRNSDALLESGPRYERRRRDHRDPKREIRIAFGEYDDGHDDTTPAYTRITLDRKDVQALNELHVVNADGGFDDWVADSDYDGGVGTTHRGEDFWVRVNNGGVSELYLDVHAMDDEIASLSNSVYVSLSYGHEGIPRNVRRAVAFRAGADLVEDALIEIPAQASIYNIETKAEEMREQAEQLLKVYRTEKP